jgi:hypothetical protein
MATYESCERMNSSQLTSYAEVFPVSRTLSPGSEEPPTMTATSGPKCSESFAQLSPDGCWLKMYQGCFHPRLDGSLEAFAETWPRAGILSGGTAYQRQPLARRIKERESSLSENWLTPDAHCTRGNLTRENLQRRMNRGMPITLNDQIQHPKMWPTPTQSDGAGGPGCSGRSGGENLRTAAAWGTPTANTRYRSDDQRIGRKPNPAEYARDTTGTGGQLNPDWVECLMGFPVGWTRLDTHGPQGQGKSSTTGSRRE